MCNLHRNKLEAKIELFIGGTNRSDWAATNKHHSALFDRLLHAHYKLLQAHEIWNMCTNSASHKLTATGM